ncbi:MAG: radical SAM protein [Deltaproteobacteria bacterium]|nr:radical SAM protein [Deltaproteobacteria bacterium]
MMLVSEIFESIQGESTRCGEPTVFVRLAGCNLDCHWCDTRHARDGGMDMTAEDVLERALAPGIGQVCVTGGEPLFQADTPDLLEALLTADRTTVLMTNGSLPMDRVPEAVFKVVDVKTPWSHGTAPGDVDEHRPPPHFLDHNLSYLGRGDEVKFVVRNRAEFQWATDWARHAGLFQKVHAVLVGPAWGELDPATLVEWMRESGLPLRLNLQWHKFIWGSDTTR